MSKYDRIEDYRRQHSHLLSASMDLDAAISYGGDEAIVEKIEAAAKQVVSLMQEINDAILALMKGEEE